MTTPDQYPSRSAPLSPERWARLRALVDDAITIAPEHRAAHIAAACNGDAALADQVARLAAACDRADDGWGFLAQSAGDLSAPLLALATELPSAGYAVDAEVPLRRGRSQMADVLARLQAALVDRYRVERELATGGMATVYLARDVRHERQVAIKVLHPELSALLGAERFLSEIKTTASLHHPHILPLFDSGSAGDLLYYVMPLVEGESLRARIAREKQLPVADAVAIVREIADALEYAHRRGVVHRDVKPENVLLHEGKPLVADFGIALAMQSAGAERMTRTGISLGTPPYMSPEQASGSDTIDGRSDVYSLACVLYEMLVGDPPFTGSTPQIVIARVLVDPPLPLRTVRPNVPVHIEAAIAHALAKLPADRPASAREFADSLIASDDAPLAVAAHGDVVSRPLIAARSTRWPMSLRFALGTVVVIGLAGAGWIVSRELGAPAESTEIRYANLIDQSNFSSATITPNGRAIVYTGSAEAGKPLMLKSLGESAPRTLRGTEGAIWPSVSPDGRRLFYHSGTNRGGTVPLPDAASGGATGARRTHWPSWIEQRLKGKGWRYGNDAWDGTDALVQIAGTGQGLERVPSGTTTPIPLTRTNAARGESRHDAPLVLSDARAVVFTISMHGGQGLLAGPLAIASLDPGATLEPHAWLGIEGRHALAFVDGWLLYTSVDGLAIMAAKLDVAGRKIVGTPIAVREESGGNIETGALADDGSLFYVIRPRDNYPVLVDSVGAQHPLLAAGEGPFMYARLSPDGKRFAVQVGTPDGGNDVWVYDIATRTPTRLTTKGRALHPTWTPDGRRIVYKMAGAGLVSQLVDGTSAPVKLTEVALALGPTVALDGSMVLYHQAENNAWRVWSASPTVAGMAHRVMEDSGSQYMPALSPDGHWLAYVATGTGENEIFVRPFPGPGAALKVSNGGGVEPAWSPDGAHIYYRAQGAFMEAGLRRPALAITSRRQLFKDTFDGAMPHRNYDVAPDGSGFLMISGGASEAVVVLDWLPELRSRLSRAK